MTQAFANPYVWNYGDLVARNLTTGDHIKLHLKKKGWVSKKDFTVKGQILDRDDQEL